MPRPEELDSYAVRERIKESRSSPDLILKLAHWDRYDFAQEEVQDTDIDRMAVSVREDGGLYANFDPILCLKMIDHGMVEPRPVAIKKLFSANIFPLTMRGYRAIIMSEQGFSTATALGEFFRTSNTPDWPLERKINTILLEQARWHWVTLKRRKMTYSLKDALNNDILFIIRNSGQADEHVWLPDDDVPLFRLRYEQAKKHPKLA